MCHCFNDITTKILDIVQTCLVKKMNLFPFSSFSFLSSLYVSELFFLANDSVLSKLVSKREIVLIYCKKL